VHLARHLNDARKDGLPGWDRIEEALRWHVKHRIRSGNEQGVRTAIHHLRAAADEGAPVFSALLTEISTGTTEWKQWEKRDPVNANSMAHYVNAFKREAVGDRDWLRARQEWKHMLAIEEQIKQLDRNDLQKDTNKATTEP
jgi:hypothetical protein